MSGLSFFKILFSPFKRFTIKVYCGKTRIGVPYFYPRRWVKTETGNRAVPLRVGFSYCGLGYKTKWSNTDYRYEYGPVFSFVFFGYQLAIMIGNKNPDEYWTAWLYYENWTDKKRSKRERILQCMTEFPKTCTIYYADGKKETINYYQFILKRKYLK